MDETEKLPSDEYIMGFVEGKGSFCCEIEKYTDYKPRKTNF